ncbi:MAG: hypothetical protein EON86_13115 [Brevundimonas sp.]|nr:MAG: hypothetical protein EON86_13115 [Brevundimonas sp.]
MLAAVFAAALIASPPQSDELSRNVVIDVCLPFVNGETDRTALDALGFVVASQEGPVTELVSPDERQRYQLRLVADDGAEDDGEVARVCLLQARSAGLDAVKGAVRRPLEQAGFVLDPAMPADRPIWTRQGVTVSIRQNEGRATMVRVTYSSLDQ